MKRSQTIGRALALLFCLLALGGCDARDQGARENGKEGEPLLVGYSQLGTESAFRVRNSQSMQEAARAMGVNLLLENANQQQAKQIEALRSFIAYQVDVIAFSPIVETGWDNVLLEAQRAGIPVILVDRMVASDASLYACYIGSDFLEQGRAAGEYLIKKADSMGATHLNVVEISGTLDSTPMRQRQQGFMEAIEGDARFTVLESISGDFLLSKGRECMRALLETYGEEIDVLYSHNDGMTLGAVEVIEQAGLTPGRDILIITVDAEQAAIDMLAQGRVNCVIECTPNLGPLVMEQAQRLVAGEAVEKVLHPQERVFSDFDDDLASLPPRGY